MGEQTSWPGALIICVIAAWIWVAGGQDLATDGTTEDLMCNGTLCEKSPGYKAENSAPPGINDKTHYKDANGSHQDPFERGGPYWLVPPFLIGASAVIIIYIVGHCLYLHCYATKKMRRLAEQHYPPTIVISDEPTSTASYKTFTPIVRYNEQGEVVEGQSFVFYQPFDDDEWERQLELRRCSSARSSFRSSFRSSSRRSSSRKKSISLQLPKLFGSKRPSVSSTSGTEQQPSPSSPRPPRVCFIPVGRSLSVPAATDKAQVPSPSQGYLFSPVVLARTQSCKSTRKPSIQKPPKLNGSASDGELLPQTTVPPAPMIIIGSGDSLVLQQSATGGATSAASPSDVSPSAADANAPICPAATSTTKPEVTQKDKMESQVLFQVGDVGEESEVLLCDIKEEHEDN